MNSQWAVLERKNVNGSKDCCCFIEGFRTGLPYWTSPPTLHRVVGTICGTWKHIRRHGVTRSAFTVPSGLALAYGYANISYTGPRDSFHLPDPIFPPMRRSRASGETVEEDVRPSTRGVPPSEQPRETGFRDTVRGGQGKLHRGGDFSPLLPPAAQHSTFNSPNVDRLGLGEERLTNETSGQSGRVHSRPEVPSGRGGVVGDGRLNLHLNLDTNLETINQTGVPDEHTRRPNLAAYDTEWRPNRFSWYEADFRPLNTHVFPERSTHRDQDQYSRLPGNVTTNIEVKGILRLVTWSLNASGSCPKRRRTSRRNCRISFPGRIRWCDGYPRWFSVYWTREESTRVRSTSGT